MRFQNTCTSAFPSGERGFILALCLVFLTATIALTLAAASLALVHLKSAGAFADILGRTLLAGEGDDAKRTSTFLGAPEGWDHIHFSSVLVETRTEGACAYSMRVMQSQPCSPILPMDLVPARSPGILVLLDDSQLMRISSGFDYEPQALYLKNAAGQIVRVSGCSEIASSLATTAGTFFRGDFGNSHERAPTGSSRTGAMSCWTFALSNVYHLLAGLDHACFGLESTSGGLRAPFSPSPGPITRVLASACPTAPEAPLAEALFRAIDRFNDPRLEPRHIVVATAGIPLSDGDLPGWLRDYDRDGDPMDTAVEGEGSHCLDDVAAYARSRGVRVHVIGPDTPLLRAAASKG